MNEVVYISCAESKKIEVWKLNNNGKLNLIQIIKTKGQTQPLCINKKKKLLYVTIRPNYFLLIYKISSNGLLKFYKKNILSSSVNHISLDQSNKFIFLSSYHYGNINIFILNKNGYLFSKPYKIISNLKGCHSSYTDLKNKKLFISALKKDSIYIYNLNIKKKKIFKKDQKIKTGFNFGPRHMSFNKNKKYAYSINEINGSIDVWKIKNLNKIIKKQNINIIPKKINYKPWSSDIHIHPSGKFLYACDRTYNLITLFHILNNGSFLLIKKYFITEIQPRSFNINSNGKFLIVAGQKSNTISCYSICNITGDIKFVSNYTVNKGPLWVLFKNF